VDLAAPTRRLTRPRNYQAEDGALTGTATTDNSDSQANGVVVTGVSDGNANPRGQQYNYDGKTSG
jgi:hypothetical protein